ncbi:hypothetical protein UMM65_02330 [Aureibaculum sp. 2210JD6-5]|uniref:hypothetical protein n=1 Tax=Aureibaculum sp. 2210JD6-5 TaxID=3103957 RepID=UPI002AAD7762|nr:hypothetical protein [Aureibaculum sp. 2210JD6-5]MDY7394063.1 hypothetical protein [Aureibaculum sp. 2210JD6-5]
MKKCILLFAFSVCTLSLFAQSLSTTTEVKIGDVFEIGEPKTNTYKHINFPKPNIIIKRGGIVNYNKVKGSMVVITSVKEKDNGTIEVKIKRKDGGRFFGSHHVIEADFNNALSSGELLAE